MSDFVCGDCQKSFSTSEALEQHQGAKHSLQKSSGLTRKNKKTALWGVVIIVVLIFIVLFWQLSNAKTLPPTDIARHIEVSPPSHVMKNPMRMEIQKHMLEHADGIEGGKGGVVINYDCESYSCETGMIERLEAFAGKYDYVYVAPYRNMKNKIALTRLNQISVLDEYDEKMIEDFILLR
ncbi:hypothetical protein J4401_05215 [Candidatus Woesearchaeota archaeon]|nr:hypothetical protein [Candidatus Woesearchaeota archaeon]